MQVLTQRLLHMNFLHVNLFRKRSVVQNISSPYLDCLRIILIKAASLILGEWTMNTSLKTSRVSCMSF